MGLNFIKTIGHDIKNEALAVWHDIVGNHGKEFTEQAINMGKAIVQTVVDPTKTGTEKEAAAISLLTNWGKTQGKNLLYMEAKKIIMDAYCAVFGSDQRAQAANAAAVTAPTRDAPTTASAAQPASASN